MQRLIASLVSLGMMVGGLIAGAEGDTKTEALLKQAKPVAGLVAVVKARLTCHAEALNDMLISRTFR